MTTDAWRQVFEGATFVSSLLAIVGFYIVIRHWRIAQMALDEERRDRIEQRERQKTTTLTALRSEVESVVGSISKDLSSVKDSTPSKPLTTRSGESVISSSRFFVWTPLPDAILEQVIKEMWLLSLSDSEARHLQELRRRILKVNNLIHAKLALFPALSAPFGHEAEQKIDNIDGLIRDQFHDIQEICVEINKWPRDDRDPNFRNVAGRA